MRYLESSVIPSYTSTLPVSLTEMKKHLRVTFSTEDSIITSYILAATRYIEERYQLVLITASVAETFSRLPSGSGSTDPFNWWVLTAGDSQGYLPLKIGNATAITSITASTVTAPGTFGQAMTTGYYLDTGFNHPRIFAPEGWSFGSISPFQIKVTYSAGWANEAAVPSAIKVAVMLMAANMYENRIDSPQQMIQASEILMRPFATVPGI